MTFKNLYVDKTIAEQKTLFEAHLREKLPKIVNAAVISATNIAERIARNKGLPFNYESELLNQEKVLADSDLVGINAAGLTGSETIGAAGGTSETGTTSEAKYLHAMMVPKGNHQSKLGIDPQ